MNPHTRDIYLARLASASHEVHDLIESHAADRRLDDAAIDKLIKIEHAVEDGLRAVASLHRSLLGCDDHRLSKVDDQLDDLFRED